jgi:hypothetical protein
VFFELGSAKECQGFRKTLMELGHFERFRHYFCRLSMIIFNSEYKVVFKNKQIKF